MILESRIFEVDCDGVLADIYTPAEKLVKARFYNDPVYSRFTFGMVHNWGMTHLREDVRQYIFSMFADRDYMYNLELYPKAFEALKLLLQLADTYACKVEINTAVVNKGVAEARTEWLKNLQRLIGYNFDFNVFDSNIRDMGADKVPKNALTIIEDNLHIIRASSARYPYIIGHVHNAEKTNTDFKDVFTRSKRVKNILVAVKDFEAVLYGISSK